MKKPKPVKISDGEFQYFVQSFKKDTNHILIGLSENFESIDDFIAKALVFYESKKLPIVDMTTNCGEGFYQAVLTRTMV